MALRAIAPRTKRRDGLTPSAAAQRDRCERARPPGAEYDADVYAAAAELAARHGVAPDVVFDEIEERAAALAYGNASADAAVRLAWLHVLERYER